MAAAEEATSDLALLAAQRALASAGLGPEDLDMIVLGTVTPDYPTPATAALARAGWGEERLRLRRVGGLRRRAGGAGGGRPLRLLRAVPARPGDWCRRAQPVGRPRGSQHRRPLRRRRRGAGARPRRGRPRHPFEPSSLDGSHASILGVSLDRARGATAMRVVHMNGREVYRLAVRTMVAVAARRSRPTGSPPTRSRRDRPPGEPAHPRGGAGAARHPDGRFHKTWIATATPRLRPSPRRSTRRPRGPAPPGDCAALGRRAQGSCGAAPGAWWQRRKHGQAGVRLSRAGLAEVGMGRALAERFAEARAVFAEADAALGEKLSQLCFEGPEEELSSPRTPSRRSSTVEPAAAALLRARASRPALVRGPLAGRVLGAGGGGRAAVRGRGPRGARARHASCRRRCRRARARWPRSSGSTRPRWSARAPRRPRARSSRRRTATAPEQMVIAGHAGAVERACGRAQGARRQARSMPLPVSAPFHCALMDAGARAHGRACSRARIGALRSRW